MGKKKQQAPPVTPPAPQGRGKKRTPQSAFDPAAGKDVYEPEKVSWRSAFAKGGITQYQIKWPLTGLLTGS